MANWLALIGLGLTLIGAVLLFWHGLLKKKFGNVIMRPDGTVEQFDADARHREVRPHEWQPIAHAFLRRARRMNVSGFALIATGTVLQMLAVVIQMMHSTGAT